MKSDFIHLHLHTEYSLLDGAIKISDVSKKDINDNVFLMAQKYNMPAMAITDHGNIFGAVEFYEQCIKNGIKPIIGCEMYIASGSRLDRKGTQGEEVGNSHLVLLVRNQEGYQNLCKLISSAYLEGFYYKPRIDRELLSAHSGGLIGLSACLKGEIPTYIVQKRMELAEETANYYKEIFAHDCFYLEVQKNGIREQEIVNEGLIQLAKKAGLPLVATNDCHYLNKEDFFLHDLMLCIHTNRKLDDANRMRFETDKLYFKPPEEMINDFSHIPGAIENTVKIASMTGFEFDFKNIHLPVYEVPEKYTLNSYLQAKCEEGMKKRFSGRIPDSHQARLKYELDTINEMGFSGYFLIVWDFIKFAKENDIFVGFGRGSGAGSIVAYALGITEVDPLKYDLLFERFLNKSRKTMPDLDIDFEDRARDRIISYIKQKYGENRVSHIGTFQSILSKNAVKDVGRVLGIPAQDTQKLANIIAKESQKGDDLKSLMQNNKEIIKLKNQSPLYSQLFTFSQKLENRKRNLGSHAAGIVITVDDITKSLPLAKTSNDVVVTQYEGTQISKLGLLKIDILGITNLSTVHDTLVDIGKRHKKELLIKEIPLDDKKTYEFVATGKTIGVFQLEGSSMRELLRKIKPECMGDIIATIALHRPGPMQSGMLDDYVLCKHGKKEVVYDAPQLKEILSETYGIILYQEQVMKVAVELAGFSPEKADDFRSSMSKKKEELIQAHHEAFVEGVRKKGISPKKAEEIFQKLFNFAFYGFNKSHSAAYGLLSYITAYLKLHYPLEYMSNLLSNQMKDEDKYLSYIDEVAEMGIDLMPPDINRSEIRFSIEDKCDRRKKRKRLRDSGNSSERGAVRVGLIAVKGAGEKALESILLARQDGPFASMPDFCMRVNLRQVNKKVVESLIKSGAFDCFGRKRKTMSEAVEKIMGDAEKIKKTDGENQLSLFDDMTGSRIIKDIVDDSGKGWPEHTLLSGEKESLGFYMSGHPLVQYEGLIKLLKPDRIEELKKGYDGAKARVAGIVLELKKFKTRTGKTMAVIRLEDLSDTLEIIFYEETFEKIKHLLTDESIILVEGRYSNAKNSSKIMASDVFPIDGAIERLARSLTLNISTEGMEPDILDKLKIELSRSPGQAEFYFNARSVKMDDSGRENLLKIKTDFKVKPTPALLQTIENMFGENSFELGY